MYIHIYTSTHISINNNIVIIVITRDNMVYKGGAKLHAQEYLVSRIKSDGGDGEERACAAVFRACMCTSISVCPFAYRPALYGN